MARTCGRYKIPQNLSKIAAGARRLRARTPRAREPNCGPNSRSARSAVRYHQALGSRRTSARCNSERASPARGRRAGFGAHDAVHTMTLRRWQRLGACSFDGGQPAGESVRSRAARRPPPRTPPGLGSGRGASRGHLPLSRPRAHAHRHADSEPPRHSRRPPRGDARSRRRRAKRRARRGAAVTGPRREWRLGAAEAGAGLVRGRWRRCGGAGGRPARSRGPSSTHIPPPPPPHTHTVLSCLAHAIWRPRHSPVRARAVTLKARSHARSP